MRASATSPANAAHAVHQAVVADGITVTAKKAVAADGAVAVKAVADGPAAAAAETETSTSKGQISLGAGRGLSPGHWEGLRQVKGKMSF